MVYGTILIVDDEEQMLHLLDIELSSEGYNVIKAKDAKEAIQKAQAMLPDVILLDILMPNMDGTQVARALKASPRTKDIPIIFLTAILKKEEEMRRKIERIKVENIYYLTLAKPLDSQRLLMLLSRIFTAQAKLPRMEAGVINSARENKAREIR